MFDVSGNLIFSGFRLLSIYITNIFTETSLCNECKHVKTNGNSTNNIYVVEGKIVILLCKNNSEPTYPETFI
jgi:hypothetical protein